MSWLFAGIPRILEGPKDVKARVGETVRFSCQTAALSPVILWEKNRRKLPHDERWVWTEMKCHQLCVHVQQWLSTLHAKAVPHWTCLLQTWLRDSQGMVFLHGFSLYATMETSFDGVCFLCGRSVGGFDSSMRLNYNISTGDPCVFILCRAWVLKCLLHYILVRQHLNIISTTGSSKYHGYMALNVESDVKPPSSNTTCALVELMISVFLYARRKTGRIMEWPCPSVHNSLWTGYLENRLSDWLHFLIWT